MNNFVSFLGVMYLKKERSYITITSFSRAPRLPDRGGAWVGENNDATFDSIRLLGNCSRHSRSLTREPSPYSALSEYSAASVDPRFGSRPEMTEPQHLLSSVCLGFWLSATQSFVPFIDLRRWRGKTNRSATTPL